MKRYVKGSLQTHRDDDYVMGIIRELQGYDMDDDSHDDEIIELGLYDTNNDIFDAICDYEGLPGWGDSIRDMVLDVYDVNLDDYSE